MPEPSSLASPPAGSRPLVSVVHAEPTPYREATLTPTATTTKHLSYRGMTSSTAAPLTGYTGRYTQPDPIGLSGGDWNVFGYGLQNPTSNVDPAGLATSPKSSGQCCGQDFLTCLNACIQAGDPFRGGTKLALTPGTPIPKWILERLGLRIGGFAGASRFTTAGSVVNRLCRLGARGPLRVISGRVFFPAFVTYGVYLATLEAYCAGQCANDSCFVVEGCE
jgi:RHS repeat-associated protein